MSYRFPKSVRLRKRGQFQKMNQQAKRFVGHLILLDVRQNQLMFTRLGITVSRHYGEAHERNRFKRIIREAFRLSREKLHSGFDINIRPRSAAKSATTLDIQNELETLMRQPATVR